MPQQIPLVPGGGSGPGWTGTIVLPPPPVPCPPGSVPPPAGNCRGGQMIRVSKIGAGSSCCTYIFNLSCMSVGDAAAWGVQFENNDDENPPVFNFVVCQNVADGDQTGYVPFQIDDHPGFSDEDETLDGYVYVAGPLDGGGDDMLDWAETAYLEIADLAGGFSSLTVTAVPYDASTQTVGDVDNPLTTDLTDYVSCSSITLSAGTTNWYASGTDYPYPVDPGALDVTNLVATTFYGSGSAHCAGEGGFLTTEITSATIVSGHVDYFEFDGVDSPPCSGGCGALNDVASCSPSIIDPDCIVNSADISGPVDLVQDMDNPGVWYTTTSLIELGAHTTPGYYFCLAVVQVETNLGTVDWIIAHTACF